MTDTFRFRQFALQQDNTIHKVGIDSVLLGAYPHCKDPDYILDIGAGTGILALMSAQQYPNAIIDAVEADRTAYGFAAKNCSESKFHHRITVFHSSVQQFKTIRKYSLIISNPPYFSDGILPNAMSRRMARHTTDLSPEAFFEKASGFLTDEGIVTIIIPGSEKKRFIEAAEQYNLYVVRLIHVKPFESNPPNRLIVTFSFLKQTAQSETLYIRDKDGTYSHPFKSLTSPFYLQL